MMRARTLLLAGLATFIGIGLIGCDPEKMAGEEPVKKTNTTKTTPPPEPYDVSKLKTAPADGDTVGIFETSMGRIVFMFYPEIAPAHVERFKKLISEGFYDGTRFHRCMPGFMIQGGDPNSRDMSKSATWGSGGYVVDGVEQNIQAEFNLLPHTKGVMSTARSGHPDSASSQFFIVHDTALSLDMTYTAWGRVVEGLEVVDKIVATGPTDQALNGAVPPSKAVVLKKATLDTWPLK
jgi:peptidyl-prolyl cis-trans isomerase B (cyclophilin B)